MSNLGNIKSTKGYFLTTHFKKGGYVAVNLFLNGKRKEFLISRLVASTFISNSNNLPFVNHINENKSENRVNNLEWCDAKYNNNYGTRTERATKKLSKPVLQLDLDNNLVEQHPSARAASRKTGVNSASIIMVCNNKRKTAGKFKWIYF